VGGPQPGRSARTLASVRSEAATPQAYLAELPDDRREVVAAVREALADAMPEGYEETVAWGMPTWQVPLERYADTYNGQPLAYVSLAAQKRHYAIYLMALVPDSSEAEAFERRWTEGGRRLDMGKSCLRFKHLDDLDLPLLAEVVAGTPVDDYLARYERARSNRTRP
jgi:uncharacterized protein YdhG (YjbR/CyaY superfamily)